MLDLCTCSVYTHIPADDCPTHGTAARERVALLERHAEMMAELRAIRELLERRERRAETTTVVNLPPATDESLRQTLRHLTNRPPFVGPLPGAR